MSDFQKDKDMWVIKWLFDLKFSVSYACIS